MPSTIWCRSSTLIFKTMARQYMITPPPMAVIAPYLLALGQKRPKISTQKKAVSRPPKANMLICQITLGGLMAMA